MGNQYRAHYFECDVLFLSAVVVLTQTTGLLNHLKPLLCYVMLCYVSPAMNAASLVSSYFVTTFAHALTGNVSILWMRRLESSFVIS